jgi:hypothetical protein
VWQVVEQVAIAAPPGRVWRVLADIEGHAGLVGDDVRAIRMKGPLTVGTTFETEPTRDHGAIVTQNRIDVVDEARELAWTSFQPSTAVSLDDSSARPREVQWWFRLAPGWTGTDVEHGCRATSQVGDDAFAAEVRARMLVTLANLKAKAELSDR